MSLSVGIIGLPNVGKSTIFNALTQAQNAECANYPFCTIDSNRAAVPVPDRRVDVVAEKVKPERMAYAAVEFIDIAGLVKGASQGEGLGNQFLGRIREVDALLHIVRCFDDDNVAHVEASPDPVRDIEIINTELILADLQTLDKRLGGLEKETRNDKSVQPLVDAGREFHAWLNAGKPLITHPGLDSDAGGKLRRETHFLTDKQVIYCCNVGEKQLAGDRRGNVEAVEAYAREHDAEALSLCGSLEAELIDLGHEQQREFLDAYGLDRSGLDQVIHAAYRALRLHSFITAQPSEVRAWTFREGCTAPQAAGKIHTDFEQGFIRAKIVAFADFELFGSMAAAREAGAMRTEGKEYEMRDGDVVEFLFNT